ncbi:hypothetical protein [Lactococcus ileimucosae]|uniref:hypothetical protein n=1 Tax=Lactococcus ileimucosae TaxID=2941329 RepID=UPI0035166D72
MRIIQNNKFMHRALLAYWLLLPSSFLVLVLLLLLDTGDSFMELLTSVPSLSLGLLLSCLSFFLAYQFHHLYEQAGMKKFLFVALLQQVFTLNFIGAGLAYLNWRLTDSENKKEKLPLIHLFLLGFTVVFSLLAVFVLTQSVT